MAKRVCPDCKIEMKEIVEPDMTRHECEKCGGVYLEPGELNILATGMAGDIEYNSTDTLTNAPVKGTRSCPSCSKTMETVHLLEFLDTTFDFCRDCKGFFLVRDELAAINNELRKLSPSHKSENFRGYKNGHFVRIEQFEDAGVGLRYIGKGQQDPFGDVVAELIVTHRILVFLKAPLPAKLHLTQEGPLSRILKTVHRFKDYDGLTGSKTFDDAFVVHTADPTPAMKVLNQKTRENLLKFLSDKPRIFGEFGKLEIFDQYVCYIEGPYRVGRSAAKEVMTSAEQITSRLIEIAEALELATAEAK